MDKYCSPILTFQEMSMIQYSCYMNILITSTQSGLLPYSSFSLNFFDLIVAFLVDDTVISLQF